VRFCVQVVVSGLIGAGGFLQEEVQSLLNATAKDTNPEWLEFDIINICRPYFEFECWT
jgi:hypothetical protein